MCLSICFSWISSRTNVLLSRIINLKGLYFISNYTSNAIKTNMDASQEYDRLRKDCPFIPDLGLTCKKYWSANNMVKYSTSSEACHWYLRWCIFPHWYFVFCIQKHILPGENILYIENTLNQVNILYNNFIDKYQSISFCYTDWVVLLSHEK